MPNIPNAHAFIIRAFYKNVGSADNVRTFNCDNLTQAVARYVRAQQDKDIHRVEFCGVFETWIK